MGSGNPSALQLWRRVMVMTSATLLLLGMGPLDLYALASHEEVDRDPRIVGGLSVSEGEWPFLVFVGMKRFVGNELDHHCGGSLVHPEFVLTAAHCVFNAEWRLAVLAGYTTLPEDGSPSWDNVTEVTSYIYHPSYQDEYQTNDVALLWLASPLTLDGVHVSTVSLNNDSTCPTPPQYCTVAGWGKTDYNGSVSSWALEVNVTSISNDVCNDTYYDITEDKLCAGELDTGGKDSCLGDSGGPLMSTCNGTWSQVGVVSYGTLCADQEYPGVYSRLSHHWTWLQEVLTSPLTANWTLN